MEEIIISPTDINRADVDMVLYPNIDCLNKKRKFPAEQFGLPLPKHKCSSSYALECSSSNANPQELYRSLFKGVRPDHDTSQTRSGEDSNSFSEDVDSIMSISGEVKDDLWCSKVMSSDQPSTSSVNWGSNCPEKCLYSLESRSMTKSNSDKMKASYIGDEKNLLYHDFGLHSSPVYEDHLLELESHEDYSCAEYGTEAMEPYTDKELEDLLYSNRVTPNNYVLSSGRWTVNQDAQQGATKLTIDKEFEQHFSMLML